MASNYNKAKNKEHPYDIIPRLGRAFFDAVNNTTGGQFYRDHPILEQNDESPRQELHLRWNRGLLVEMFPQESARAQVCAEAIGHLLERYPQHYKHGMVTDGRLRRMVSESLTNFDIKSWTKDFDRGFDLL